MANNEFEIFLGIDTETPLTQKENPDYFRYEPSEYAGLIKIFDRLPLSPYDTLVDFGCGSGRVLFYCNQRFMCNVTGVEYDKKVYDALTKNADAYHSRFLNQRRKFCLLRMTAEEYVIEPTDNYFYFFNPFSDEVLRKVLDNIIESYQKNNRRITVIFYYCTYNMMTVIRKYPFKLKELIKLPDYDNDPEDKAYIYYIE